MQHSEIKSIEMLFLRLCWLFGLLLAAHARVIDESMYSEFEAGAQQKAIEVSETENDIIPPQSAATANENRSETTNQVIKKKPNFSEFQQKVVKLETADKTDKQTSETDFANSSPAKAAANETFTKPQSINAGKLDKSASAEDRNLATETNGDADKIISVQKSALLITTAAATTTTAPTTTTASTTTTTTTGSSSSTTTSTPTTPAPSTTTQSTTTTATKIGAQKPIKPFFVPPIFGKPTTTTITTKPFDQPGNNANVVGLGLVLLPNPFFFMKQPTLDVVHNNAHAPSPVPATTGATAAQTPSASHAANAAAGNEHKLQYNPIYFYLDANHLSQSMSQFASAGEKEHKWVPFVMQPSRPTGNSAISVKGSSVDVKQTVPVVAIQQTEANRNMPNNNNTLQGGQPRHDNAAAVAGEPSSVLFAVEIPQPIYKLFKSIAGVFSI